MSSHFHALRSERGQASVEFVAMLPFILLLGALVWQLALVGHAAWMCAHAARVAARADAVGRDARSAARSALPGSLEPGMRLSGLPDGGVNVRVRVPLLLPSWRSPVSVSATAALGGAR